MYRHRYSRHIDKRVDNPSTDKDRIDTNGGADYPGKTIDIADTNREANDFGIDISTKKADINRRAKNLSKSIDRVDTNADKIADPSKVTNIADLDKDRRIDQGIGTDTKDVNIDDRVNNLGAKTADIDGQAVASNKAYTTFFSLCKALLLSFYWN